MRKLHPDGHVHYSGRAQDDRTFVSIAELDDGTVAVGLQIDGHRFAMGPKVARLVASALAIAANVIETPGALADAVASPASPVTWDVPRKTDGLN